MSLVDFIFIFIMGACIGALIVNFIWYRLCKKINSDWHKACTEMNEKWANFYDVLIESSAKEEEEGGSDENDIT